MATTPTQAFAPVLTDMEDRHLQGAVRRAEEFFGPAEVPAETARHDGVMLSRPCPANPLWRLDMRPAAPGSEQFLGVFVNVLTGATFRVNPRIGADAVLLPDGLGVLVTEASNDGFRNRIVQVTLTPEQSEPFTYRCLYDAPSRTAQIRLLSAGDGADYALAICAAGGTATVLLAPVDTAEDAVPLIKGCHSRVLAVGDRDRIVISDLTDDGSRLHVFDAHTLKPAARVATETWSDRMAAHFADSLRLDGTDLHVIVHQGPQMSLWRLGLQTGELARAALPDTMPCLAIAFAPTVAPSVILQQADLHPVSLSISRLHDGQLTGTDLAPHRAQGLETWRVRVSLPDGTRVDLTLCARRDLLDAQLRPLRPLPTLVYSYASYGRPSVSDFCPDRAEMIRGGMLYVMAHLRGGGEYGPAWHRAGRNTRRVQCSDDLEAVVDALTTQGYSRAGSIVGRSRSAGCQVFALSAARRPDLFVALILHYPVLNLCRLFTSDASRGAVADLEEWADVASVNPSICPTAQAAAATRVPHALIDTSLRDTRCPPEQTASWLVATACCTDSLQLVRLHDDAAHGSPLTPREGRDTWAFVRWAMDQPDRVRQEY